MAGQSAAKQDESFDDAFSQFSNDDTQPADEPLAKPVTEEEPVTEETEAEEVAETEEVVEETEEAVVGVTPTPTLEPTPTATRPPIIPAPQVVPRSALVGTIAYGLYTGQLRFGTNAPWHSLPSESQVSVEDAKDR